MRRRFLFGATGSAIFSPWLTRAQEPGRIYRIGWVTGTPITDPSTVIFLEVLRDNGFAQGKNLIVNPRGFSLRPDQMMPIARQIAEDRVDLFLTGGSAGTQAAQAATSTIPILAITDDMVGEGLVGSLANRRGNTTGNRCSAVAPPTFPVIPITKNMRLLLILRDRALPCCFNG